MRPPRLFALGIAVPSSNYCAEREILRICAGRKLTAVAVSRLRDLVGPDTDWKYLIKWAAQHRILPQLHLNLKSTCPEQVPSAIAQELQRTYFLNASQNLRFSGELIRLIQLFELEGIEVIPFKGPLLAETVYGTVSARQFGDLDLLVRSEDVSRARHLLMAAGYIPEFALEGKIAAEYLRSEHAFQFQKPDAGFVVELHWRFGSRDQAFPLGADAVWQRHELQDFHGHMVRTLASEDLLFYLALHGAKHAWDRLEWISCLREFILCEGAALDWSEILERARSGGALRGLHIAMLLADSLGGAGIPDDLLLQARLDRYAAQLARRAVDRLFVELDHSSIEVARHIYYLRSRERARDQARIVLFSCSRIPHPLAKDWRLFRVPASMSFLYYLLRPLRLLREHGLPRLRAMFRQDATIQEGKYL